jgi:hypothetical protein
MALQNQELEDWYQDRFETYGTKGWAHIQEQFAEMMIQHNSLVGLNTLEELHFRKGLLDVIAQVINMQNLDEHAYNHILAEQTGEPVEVATGGIAKVVNPGEYPFEE